MFCSLIADLIKGEVQCGECLCEKCVNDEVMRKSIGVT